jgi:hypothetical protein
MNGLGHRGFLLTGLALVLAGCSVSTTQTSGPGMMNGTGGSGAGMGGTASGDGAYHYAALTCAAPESLPGTTVQVLLGDMGMTQMMGGTAPIGARMMLRSSLVSVPSGSISFVASNMGWRTHELVIVPLAAGQAAGRRVPASDGKIGESGSVGEASGPCSAGTGDGLTARTVGWTTVTLAPGRYELVCNLANHYANGMWQEFDVT